MIVNGPTAESGEIEDPRNPRREDHCHNVD